ncbi:MAG: plasmid pRiA4b ORF-3 family protein [Lachnospiraceae bacterium]|nr:plasmid pRiA4b ORF-3 family protein [Lachnospiraceae bacterium]
MAKYTFKVYPVGQGRTTYRTIEISGKETLDRLCEFILESFDFIHEHLYEFCMDNRMYSEDNYQYNPEDGGPSTDIVIDKIGLVKGQNFSLHYDYGDDWMFMIHVQKIEDETKKISPKLIKSVGHVEQYSNWDEWDDEEDEY